MTGDLFVKPPSNHPLVFFSGRPGRPTGLAGQGAGGPGPRGPADPPELGRGAAGLAGQGPGPTHAKWVRGVLGRSRGSGQVDQVFRLSVLTRRPGCSRSSACPS